MFKRWAAENGCGETPTVRNVLPGGLERFVGLVYKMAKGIVYVLFLGLGAVAVVVLGGLIWERVFVQIWEGGRRGERRRD